MGSSATTRLQGRYIRATKRVLSSYRWRRRFAWLGATMVVAAALVVVVLKIPNVSPKVQGPSNVPARIERSPKPVRLGAREEARALRVASQFVHTAVARKHVDRSWNLVSADFRGGLTRRQWDRGELPISPYSVQRTKWNLDYSDTQGVGYSVTIFPPKGSHEAVQDFQIGLHPLGTGKGRHWVVDYWQAVATGTALAAIGNPGPGSPTSGKAKESRVWLLLPLSLLSLILLVPLAVFGVNWYRVHRTRVLLRR
jgi:hypothetical protein